MPGIVRVKNWVAREVLVYSDLNTEFDNIINNLQASNVDGYSSTVSQMRETTDPGTVGSESLALRISDEIERIRFAINRIVGKTYWYEAPARSLSTTYVNASNYLVPNSSEEIPEIISNFVSAGFLDSSLFADAFFYLPQAKFADTKYSMWNSSRFFWVSPVSYSTESATISLWFKNFAANDVIYFNLMSGLSISLNSSGFLRLVQTVANATVNGSKTNYSIVGSSSLAGDVNYNNVIVRWKYGPSANSPSIDMFLNGTLVGTISGNDLFVNIPSTNAAPCLMGGRAFPSFTDSLTNPSSDLPSVYGWTLTGAPVTNVVAGGVHTMDPGSAGTATYYSKAVFSSIPTNGVYFESKFRLRNTTLSTVNPQIGPHFGFYLRVDAANIGFHVRINGSTITFDQSTAITAVTGGSLLAIDHNFNDWTHLAVIVKAASTFVYINGQFAGSFASPADATAGDVFAFGKILSGTSYSQYDIEYLYCGNVPTSNPQFIGPNAAAGQQISDFCHIKEFLTNATTIAALQTSSPYLLFGRPESVRAYSSNRSFVSNTSVATTTTSLLGEVVQFVSDGKTPVKLSFRCLVRQGAATAGTYNFGVYLNIRSEVLATVSGNQFINQANSGLNAGVSLSDTMQQVLTTSQVQIPMTIYYSEVLPAGYYSVFAYLANITSPAAVIANSLKCTVSL